MANLTKSRRLKRLLGRADKALWALLLGLVVPSVVFEVLVMGLIAYGHFTILDSPLHGLGYAFLCVSMRMVWSMTFFMIWNMVSCSST